MAVLKQVPYVQERVSIINADEDRTARRFRSRMWTLGESDKRHGKSAYPADTRLIERIRWQCNAGEPSNQSEEEAVNDAQHDVDNNLDRDFDSDDENYDLYRDEAIWSPVGHEYVGTGYRDLAIVELFSHAFTQSDAVAVFGCVPGDIRGPMNALIATEATDTALHFGTFVLLPVETPDRPVEYVMRRMAARDIEYYSHLEGRTLRFTNSVRLSKHYVFYHHLTAVFTAYWKWEESNRRAPGKGAFTVRFEARWPQAQDHLIRRTALNRMVQQSGVDYSKIADIIEPHVIPGTCLCSPEEEKREDAFIKKLAGWHQYDREYRNCH
jgi:hypothetical protein